MAVGALADEEIDADALSASMAGEWPMSVRFAGILC